jgi:Tol biopolymer transport system component
VRKLNRLQLFLPVIMIILSAEWALAACLDLGLDTSRRMLKVEYLPPHSGQIEVNIFREDDTGKSQVGSLRPTVVKGQKFSTELELSVLSGCIYLVEVVQDGQKSVEVKNCYTIAERSPTKRESISSIMKVPLEKAGGLLEKVTSVLLSPSGKNLFRIDVDGTNLQKLTSFTEGHIAAPRVSDSGAIVFVRYAGGDGAGEVWVLRPETRELQQVARGESPVWGTDESSIYFLNQGKLCELDVRNRTILEKPIKDGEPLDEILGWSRDGSGHLLVTLRIGPDFRQPWLLDPASGQRIRLPYDDAYLWLPNLSPSGTHIIISEYSGTGSKNNIYLQEINGENKRQLTNDTFDNESPSWSADGKSIVFVSERP